MIKMDGMIEIAGAGDHQPAPHQLYQAILRQFMGDRQYERRTVLAVWRSHDRHLPADETIVGDDAVDAWLAADAAETTTATPYTLELTQEYIYRDMMFDTSLVGTAAAAAGGDSSDAAAVPFEKVNAVISVRKAPQTVVGRDGVRAINWAGVAETLHFTVTNESFARYVALAIYLRTPNLADYRGLAISLPAAREVVTARTYFADMQRDVIPRDLKVAQLYDYGMFATADDFVATFKYDGIHHIVAVAAGERRAWVVCDSIERAFALDLPVAPSQSAILSTELVHGRFFVLDVYVVNDERVFRRAYRDRVATVRGIGLPTPPFVYPTFLSGETMDDARCDVAALEGFLAQYPDPDAFVADVKRLIPLPTTAKIRLFDNTVWRRFMSTDDVSRRYFARVGKYLRSSDRGMQLADRFDIDTHWRYVLSPAIIEALLTAYFQFGVLPARWDSIQRYVTLMCGQNAAALHSLRAEVIRAWRAYKEGAVDGSDGAAAGVPTGVDLDGIVFYRDRPLVRTGQGGDKAPEPAPQIWKWKPRDRLTVDVVLDFPREVPAAAPPATAAAAPDVPVVPCTIKYWQKSSGELTALTATATEGDAAGRGFSRIALDSFNHRLPRCRNGNLVVPDKSIVEILIDDDTGLVQPFRVRYDKLRPNGYTIVMNTLVRHTSQLEL